MPILLPSTSTNASIEYPLGATTLLLDVDPWISTRVQHPVEGEMFWCWLRRMSLDSDHSNCQEGHRLKALQSAKDATDTVDAIAPKSIDVLFQEVNV